MKNDIPVHAGHADAFWIYGIKIIINIMITDHIRKTVLFFIFVYSTK